MTTLTGSDLLLIGSSPTRDVRNETIKLETLSRVPDAPGEREHGVDGGMSQLGPVMRSWTVTCTLGGAGSRASSWAPGSVAG